MLTQHHHRRINKGAAEKHYNIRLIDAQGNIRILHLTMDMIPGTKKSIVSFIDVTEHKRSEEALRESEIRYQSIFENTGTAMLIVEDDMMISHTNAQFEILTGYKRQDVEGKKKWTEFVEKSDLERMVVQHKLRSTDKSQALRGYEFQLVHRDGQSRDVYMSVDIIADTGKSVASLMDITERKRAVEALQQAEANFRNSLDDSPMGVRIVSSEGETLYANRALLDIYGYSSTDELKAVPVTSRYMEESIAGHQLRKDQRKRGEDGPSEYEIGIVRKNDEIRHLQVFRKGIIWDGDKQFQVLYRDITERKRAEETLRRSEENYRNIFENAVMGIFHTTPEGRYLRTNPAGFKMYGYESAEDIKCVTDMSQQTYVDPKDRVKYKDIMESKGRVEAFEVEHYRKDKSKIWVVLNSRAVRDNDGSTLYYETTVEDITKRKQSEILYKTLADASHVGVYIVQHGKFQFVNPHIPEYSGYSESELLGKDSYSFVHPEDHAQLRENAIAMLKGKKTNPYEYRIIDRRGEIRRLMETVRLITYGGKRAVLGNTMDITDRYQMENFLRQAQKMQAIGTLAGGIAHDFNNILSAIMGYTEMALVSPELNNRLRHYLEQVFKAGERARDLVKQILAFSRQSDEKPRPLKVGPIVKETLKLLRASLPSTIEIHQDLHVESDVVLADPTRMHQVLMNLCTNAGHAMSNRKGELRVSLCAVEINSSDDLNIHYGLSPGTFLKLTVSDTGSGIAPDVMDRILDPFFTTKKPGEGTGMGLSVVYGIVKSFGGAITVESQMEKGSRFNVYLPLLMDEVVEREREDSSLIIGGKERILFVDDEKNLVQLGTELLTSLGYDVTGRTSSLEALELFRVKPDRFDLVITDMTMPNMTGLDLASEMMSIRPDLPIILCTGFSEMISKEKATSIGIRQFIMKPVAIRSLAKTIRKVVDGR